MLLSAVQKSTLLDYPGKIATIVFTLGCNLRCRYCHNPEFYTRTCFSEQTHENSEFIE